MNVMSPTGTALLSLVGASRARITAPAASAAMASPGAAAMPSTRVSFSQSEDVTTYRDPRLPSGPRRLWSSPVGQNDAVGALMARNSDLSVANKTLRLYSLGEQWRGIGGALLKQFDKTGEGYTQTRVDNPTVIFGVEPGSLTPDEQAQRTAAILATQAADLAGVEAHASTAGLKIQTRSGQVVELKISVNPGEGGVVGMKVELKASGSMSTDERAAVGKLADGLDRALEGLGRADAVGLDLSGLMAYDRSVIASVDLQANNGPYSALDRFALHLGDDQQTVSLKGRDGELALNVRAVASPAQVSAQQRTAAMQGALDSMDRAGARGHANAPLVEQMKAAFKALQSASSAATPATTATATAPSSGLADFDASLGGHTFRDNRSGSTHEAGQVHFQLSQTTSTKRDGQGGQVAMQTVSEQLSADFQTAEGAGTMLDVRTGKHVTSTIRDRSLVRTWLALDADHRVTRMWRNTDEERLATTADAHGKPLSQPSPSRRNVTERLI